MIRVLDCHRYGVPMDLVHEASFLWPKDDWPYWLHYSSPLESKKTFNTWAAMPEPIRELLAHLAMVDVYPLTSCRGVPDLTLHGAGMHSMGAGDHLSCHLDADTHPATGMHRVANAILFLGPWEESWGGKLEFWGPHLREKIVTVTPAPGRLVVFKTDDESFHSVSVLSCPPEVQRRSLAVYWWGYPLRVTKRPRAMFVSTHSMDDGLDAIRRARAGL